MKMYKLDPPILKEMMFETTCITCNAIHLPNVTEKNSIGYIKCNNYILEESFCNMNVNKYL